MEYTPADILDYVTGRGYEAAFLNALSLHKGGYSIAEIADGRFEKTGENISFKSEAYGIDVPVTDDDVLTAVLNELYVSAFISRKDEAYAVHFLVHRYPVSMKPQFEESILSEVLKYMMLKTIIALRLDNKEKIRKYIS